MKILLLISALLFSSYSFAQEAIVKPFEFKAAQDNYSNQALANTVEDAVFLNLNVNELNRVLTDKPAKINIEIPVSASEKINLTLERFEIFTSNAKIIERRNGNEIDRQDLRDIIVAYKGFYNGDTETLVSLNFTKNGIRGLMTTEKEIYVIGALESTGDNLSSDYILYEQSKMKIHSEFNCGTEALGIPGDIEKTMQKISTEQTDHSTTNLMVAEIALEVDKATYDIYGSSMQNTLSYVLSLLATSSALYMKDVNVRFVIPYTRVWTTPDPYTGTNSNALLNQFRSEWNANQTGVQRTLAHFVTRRAGNMGGIAWVNVLCANVFSGNGYGFSNTDGVINQLPTYSWDAMVVSHEIGHNFGSPHTHNCSWPGGPIDTCYQIEGGCYSGPTFARVGTIMSYCHLNGSIKLDFGTLPENLIRNNAEFASCMYVSNQPLVLGYPNGGETFLTNTTAKIFWGSSLTGNVNLEYSTNNGTTWIQIQNNIPAQTFEYDWAVPHVLSTTQGRVRITDSSNPLISDTSNAAFKIKHAFSTFNTVYPPINSIVSTSPNSSDTVNFMWTKASVLPITYKFNIRKITPGSTEYFFQSNNTGLDTVRTMTKGLLDSLAILMGANPGDTVSCIWKAYAYSGTDSAFSANALIVKLTRSTVGINNISSTIPDKFNLENNYPNPFNPTTKIRFDVAKLEKVNITVYDMLGRKVDILVNEVVQPGRYEVEFTGFNLSSGIYYYRMETSDFVQTKKMLLVK